MHNTPFPKDTDDTDQTRDVLEANAKGSQGVEAEGDDQDRDLDSRDPVCKVWARIFVVVLHLRQQ